MSKKRESTREDARRILRDGVLNMSVERLIQMTRFGLMGNVEFRNESVMVDNAFNCMNFNEENGCVSFSVVEASADFCYGSISFLVDDITEISGCDDKDNPEEYLNVNIRLQNNTTIKIKILY